MRISDWSSDVCSSDLYRTVLGERRVVTLADGSTVSLDAASEVRVAYSERARELALVRGQARFDVAHDPRRPFAVQARDQRVVATGTAFNVDRSEEHTSELQSLMRISYAVFCLKKKKKNKPQ